MAVKLVLETAMSQRGEWHVHFLVETFRWTIADGVDETVKGRLPDEIRQETTPDCLFVGYVAVEFTKTSGVFTNCRVFSWRFPITFASVDGGYEVTYVEKLRDNAGADGSAAAEDNDLVV